MVTAFACCFQKRCKLKRFLSHTPAPGSVVVEPLPDTGEVSGSIPGCFKQNTLKFDSLLICLATSP